MTCRLSLLLFPLILVACTSMSPAVAPATPVPPTPVPNLDAPIADGLRFLRGQYNPAYALLQESPDIGRHRYFLANDALLAAQVFHLFGEEALAAALEETLARYGVDGNGFVEAAWGVPIPWPPQLFEDPGSLVETRDEDMILTIRHEGPGYFSDWSGYSNLAFMAVHNELNLGNEQAARRLYEIETSTFDGRGFPDLAYQARDGVYETLGLAWGLYAAARLHVFGPVEQQILDRLLAQQDPEDGGFHTHFRPDADRLADPNVETTSVALLALAALQGRTVPGLDGGGPGAVDAAPSSGRPAPEIVLARAAGVAFLQSQYNPQVGLLRESPVVQPHRYWLATDNQLATYALTPLSPRLAVSVRAGLESFHAPGHGLVEALEGAAIDWPPHVESQKLVADLVLAQVWTEERRAGPVYPDWAEYADLALYGALDAANGGDRILAQKRFAQAMTLFDGVGFADRAQQTSDLYATYKLALALLVSRRLSMSPDDRLLPALLAKQGEDGGFITLYDRAGEPQGDANTETTSYALLALQALFDR